MDGYNACVTARMMTRVSGIDWVLRAGCGRERRSDVNIE